jgi:hypothetical protein
MLRLCGREAGIDTEGTHLHDCAERDEADERVRRRRAEQLKDLF